ncbi:hypothetical protein ITX31_01005 [Arthrobacter gandavensis]|nr:hypothetical protein [Arthrobacter gandavensis]
MCRSAVGTVGLAVRRRLHNPRANVGQVLVFADGTSARIYRETRVGDGYARDPVLLAVTFTLRGVRGPLHRLFRLESWLNFPLFVGFPGLASKLWLAHDEHNRYRGIYEWEGAEQAAAYVDSLSWVLGLVCVPGSIRIHIVPGVHRDAVLQPEKRDPESWWKPLSLAGRDLA